MTTYSDFRINGSSVEDCFDYRVIKSISTNNSSSEFEANINNYNGTNSSNFVINNEVSVFTGSDAFFNSSNSNNLAHYYTLDGGSPTMTFSDTIGNLSMSASDYVLGNMYWIEGKNGSAVGFSGVFAELRTSEMLAQGWSVPFTYSFWLKTSSTQSSNTVFIDGQHIAFPNSDTYVGLSLANGSQIITSLVYGSSAAIRYSTEDTTISNGSWNHYAFTYDGSHSASGIYLYLNGSNVTGSIIQDDLSANFYTTTKGFNIANVAGALDSTFGIDEISFYNRALTQSEVSQLYNSGSGLFFNSGNLIFRGILEDVSFNVTDDFDDNMVLSGRDYTARLQDVTIQPITYLNQTIGSIVVNLLSTYTPDISSSSVSAPPTTLSGISFTQISVYDALAELAGLADNYTFYVDNYKALQFKPSSQNSSGYTFDSGNTLRANIKGQRDTVYNQIWVYGDRYLSAFRESFTAGSPAGGSIFTLSYNPYNTTVTVSGTLIQPGGILNATNEAISGAKYMVDFNNKQIVFTSGTLIGSNIPVSGRSVVIDYYRALPIIKVGDDYTSQAQYGVRNKIIVDKNIKDPTVAQQIVEQSLAQYAFPSVQAELDLKGVINVTPGDSCILNLPQYNVDDTTSTIIEATYSFNKENNLSDRVLAIKANNKILDINDIIKKAILDIRKLQASEINTADVLTRLQYTTGSFSLAQSGCLVYTRNINDSFILGHPSNGVLGIINSSGVGSVFGGATWVTGVGIGYDRALSFGGIDNPGGVYISNELSGTSTTLGSNTSWFAWTKLPSTYNIGSRGGVVIGTYDLTPTSTNLEYHVSGRVRVYWNAGQVDFFSSGIDYRDDTWHHIGFVRNAEDNYIKLYCDGVVNNSGLAGSNRIINYPLMIGKDFRAGVGVPFSGAIDDVRLYNRALSDTEVGSLYAKQNVPGSLVLYYKLDENVGSSVYNSAISGAEGIQPILGDRRSAPVLVWSGCYDLVSGINVGGQTGFITFGVQGG